MDAATDLDELLRAHGYRATQPRRVVWEALRSASGHVTADELASLVRQEVDLASVYRALALFEKLGLARVSHFGDGDAGRWEPSHPDEHFHLVCVECGSVDHHVGSLVARIEEHLDDGHGFAVSEVELTVRGRCQTCRAAAEAVGSSSTAAPGARRD